MLRKIQVEMLERRDLLTTLMDGTADGPLDYEVATDNYEAEVAVDPAGTISVDLSTDGPTDFTLTFSYDIGTGLAGLMITETDALMEFTTDFATTDFSAIIEEPITTYVDTTDTSYASMVVDDVYTSVSNGDTSLEMLTEINETAFDLTLAHAAQVFSPEIVMQPTFVSVDTSGSTPDFGIDVDFDFDLGIGPMLNIASDGVPDVAMNLYTSPVETDLDFTTDEGSAEIDVDVVAETFASYFDYNDLDLSFVVV